MAGTIVADTIQDGAGNSTAMDNAIYGSAKAWVQFVGSTGAVNASYNVSSVTRTGTGAYTVNFTNAFADTKYAWNCAAGNANTTNYLMCQYGTTLSTTAISFNTYSFSGGASSDVSYNCVTVFR